VSLASPDFMMVDIKLLIDRGGRYSFVYC